MASIYICAYVYTLCTCQLMNDLKSVVNVVNRICSDFDYSVIKNIGQLFGSSGDVFIL